MTAITKKCGYAGCNNQVFVRRERDVGYCSRVCSSHAMRMGRYRGGDRGMIRDIATRPLRSEPEQ